MSYTCEYLEFGSNDKRVKGYEVDLIASNPFAPIPLVLAEPVSPNTLWGLQFTYDGGTFYRAIDDVPGTSGATIKSWYAKGGPGHHYLALTPFITGGASAGFAQVAKFVDFSETPTTSSSIDTDTIKNPAVTATVYTELPELQKLKMITTSSSHTIIITAVTTKVVFDKIFVYSGDYSLDYNVVTVNKGHSCFALAVFKEETSSSSKEVDTYQWPKIPEWEWPMIVTEIAQGIMKKGNGELFQYLSPKVIAEFDQETLRSAVTAISSKIETLDKIKTIISGLSGKKTK